MSQPNTRHAASSWRARAHGASSQSAARAAPCGEAQRSRLDLGVPPHIVRDIVGHSDIEVTMTIYAHVSVDEKRKALRKLGEALG